jgi:hypothetical protein
VKNRTRSRYRCLVAAGVLSAVGCATMPNDASNEDLEPIKEAIEAYNHAFRWKSYNQAAQFLPSEVRGPFLATYEDEESSLQVEECRIVRIHLKDASSATATVRVRFMMLPSVIVQKQTVTQHWFKVADQWILESEDNPIRTIDIGKTIDEQQAPEPDPAQLGQTEIDVESPPGPSATPPTSTVKSSTDDQR